jgi:hypothetical protein
MRQLIPDQCLESLLSGLSINSDRFALTITWHVNIASLFEDYSLQYLRVCLNNLTECHSLILLCKCVCLFELV